MLPSSVGRRARLQRGVRVHAFSIRRARVLLEQKQRPGWRGPLEDCLDTRPNQGQTFPLLSLRFWGLCGPVETPKPVEMPTLCVNRRTLYLSFIRTSPTIQLTHAAENTQLSYLTVIWQAASIFLPAPRAPDNIQSPESYILT